jgi:ParB family chromosome partitioning protein
MSNKKSALGRGLSALLENEETDVTQGSKSEIRDAQAGSISHIPLEQIEANPFQPREEFNPEALSELAESIKQQGIIQPITVRKLGYDKYQIISGERRFKASKMAGLKAIPAYIRIANDQGMLEMALVENIQRKDLNALEIALSYKRLIDECKLTQEEMSERIGKSRSSVSNFLRLLKLPPVIQAAIRDERLSMGHARAILSVEDPVAQLELFRTVMEKDMSVRGVEDVARGFGKRSGGKKHKSQQNILPAEFTRIQNVLSSHFETKVTLEKAKKGNGKIIIPFENDQDLNRILDMLNS